MTTDMQSNGNDHTLTSADASSAGREPVSIHHAQADDEQADTVTMEQ